MSELERLVSVELQTRYDELIAAGDIFLAPPGRPEPTFRSCEVQELRDGAWRVVPVAERHPGGFVVTDRRRLR